MTFDMNIYERLQTPEEKAAYMVLLTEMEKVKASVKIARIQAEADVRKTEVLHDDSGQPNAGRKLSDVSQRTETGKLINELNPENSMVVSAKFGLLTLLYQGKSESSTLNSRGYLFRFCLSLVMMGIGLTLVCGIASTFVMKRRLKISWKRNPYLIFSVAGICISPALLGLFGLLVGSAGEVLWCLKNYAKYRWLEFEEKSNKKPLDVPDVIVDEPEAVEETE
ncbi:hypothetical protein BCR33DRAFT_800201 [Rhizoclosmatium globosum]|uniref:Uncharacterized protein n=1 Tax=Rhizoclosmatium globosum TaxID=329046 RepID=A0A1Y1ZVH4_9FUNG|nr:hypothetical protein BCR33DRAFT_800201 [Rhizoclosmatium globosum]|eukprot:ORY14232.1 hypothetical protein BCR33DRAFT_800201 [Rhizoclosmatium globosum]